MKKSEKQENPSVLQKKKSDVFQTKKNQNSFLFLTSGAEDLHDHILIIDIVGSQIGPIVSSLQKHGFCDENVDFGSDKMQKVVFL